jgi:predicted DNA-binding transcriptional regulator AlpA
MERLLSSRQVCEILSVSPVTLWRHVKKGLCPPPIKLAGNHNRWPESTLMEYVASLPVGQAYVPPAGDDDSDAA